MCQTRLRALSITMYLLLSNFPGESIHRDGFQLPSLEFSGRLEFMSEVKIFLTEKGFNHDSMCIEFDLFNPSASVVLTTK